MRKQWLLRLFLWVTPFIWTRIPEINLISALKNNPNLLRIKGRFTSWRSWTSHVYLLIHFAEISHKYEESLSKSCQQNYALSLRYPSKSYLFVRVALTNRRTMTLFSGMIYRKKNMILIDRWTDTWWEQIWNRGLVIWTLFFSHSIRNISQG